MIYLYLNSAATKALVFDSIDDEQLQKRLSDVPFIIGENRGIILYLPMRDFTQEEFSDVMNLSYDAKLLVSGHGNDLELTYVNFPPKEYPIEDIITGERLVVKDQFIKPAEGVPNLFKVTECWRDADISEWNLSEREEAVETCLVCDDPTPPTAERVPGPLESLAARVAALEAMHEEDAEQQEVITHSIENIRSLLRIVEGDMRNGQYVELVMHKFAKIVEAHIALLALLYPSTEN